MPDDGLETFFDTDRCAEGEELIERAVRRVAASSRKLRHLAARIEALRRKGDDDARAATPDHDAERPVAG